MKTTTEIFLDERLIRVDETIDQIFNLIQGHNDKDQLLIAADLCEQNNYVTAAMHLKDRYLNVKDKK